MNRTSLRGRALACALLAGTAYCALGAGSASAQSLPSYRTLDANGVDLTAADHVLSFLEGSVGAGMAKLPLMRVNGSFYYTSDWENISLNVDQTGSTPVGQVAADSRMEQFTGSSLSSLTPALANGATLTAIDEFAYEYRRADGTLITFDVPLDATNPGWERTICESQNKCTMLPSSITSPNGKTVSLTWEIDENCSTTCSPIFRLSSVSNSFGYRVDFTYVASSYTGSINWWKRSSADFYKGTTSAGSVTYSYPSSSVVDVTDRGGATWRFTYLVGKVIGIRRPGASADTKTINYSSGILTSVTNEGVTTSYSRSVSGSTATMTVTDALSHSTVAVSDLTKGRPTTVTDALSRATSFTYDSYGRLTRVTKPEGNYTDYTLDGRGNVTQIQQVAKSGSGISPIITSASYPSSCSNVLTCNSPTSTTDARGQVTDYTYDSTHGGLLTVTAPAPTTGANRPQTRYSYSLVNGEYQLTGVSACQTGTAPSCVGTSDEVKTTIAYDSNGNVTSVSSGDGAGTLTATRTMTYDSAGNLLTVDGPLSGSADTTRYLYDSGARLVGTISPDPDGSGSMKPRAVRNTYTNGLLTKVERGTVNSQSDTDWAAFSTSEEVQTTYDANARPIVQKLVSGSTTYAVTQTTYDALGRVQCTAQRMNPTYFGSLPSDACTLGTASTTYGNDRITKTTYDNGGQVTLVQSGYGVTGTQADEVTSTYTNNGKRASVTDAEGNKTSYVYDGQDRLSQTQYPSSTKGSGTSNSSDYEQLTYETTAGGTKTSATVASFRNRANETIGFTYDALGRLTTKDLPGTEPDVTYTYDLLDRQTGASQSGNALSFTYDALGRNLTQVGPQGTVTSTWDLAGRRTRITHPDSFYVDQDYLVTDELQKIRENGATSGAGVLATYAYDDLGRRTSLTLGDGSSTSYGYDSVSRLTSLGHDLSGTSYDQTLGFSYNPAGQITGNTRSNDSYAWTGHYNVNRGYTANGLNQYTASGSIAPTYDTKGNLTSAGSTTYSYSSENLLTGVSGGITLSYDPMMRLYQTAGGTPGTTRFGYDGTALIAEYNSSNTLQRRYVHGSGADEPVVWYEGSGTTDRRFLHADERGSVVAIGSSSGTSVDTYDEYGIPRSSNTGRFQYTGQTWLPELGMFYYKARIYSPTLGRFLQSDPIGYGDGMNWYAYGRADPVNKTDSTGLDAGPCTFTGPPTPAQIAACQASEAERWKNYDPGPTAYAGSSEMAGFAIGQTIAYEGWKHLDAFDFVFDRTRPLTKAEAEAMRANGFDEKTIKEARVAEFAVWPSNVMGDPPRKGDDVTLNNVMFLTNTNILGSLAAFASANHELEHVHQYLLDPAHYSYEYSQAGPYWSNIYEDQGRAAAATAATWYRCHVIQKGQGC